jgi:tRNA(Leu) C34 or U34 (ribose-2'-O)-methylase TrmL
VHDVLGNALAPQWIYDDLFPSFFSRALIASQSIPSTSMRTDLTPSLEQASTSIASPSSIIEAKRAYARSLLSFSLGGHSTGQKHAKAGITGQCLAVILSCFSGSSTSAFPLIDDALCYQLLNCFQSTFMGYLPTMQTLLFEKSLKAVSVWIDLASTSPNTLIQLIKSVPNFYAHKPTISHLLRQIAALLDSANPRLRSETENTSSTIYTTERAWTETFFVSKTLEVYTSQRRSTATRSTMAIRSFANVAETGNFLSMILRLFDPTTGAFYLKIIFDTVMSKFSQDMIASTVFLASLWENTRNVAKPIWALFAERHSQDIQKSNLSESLNILLVEATAFFNAETHTADLKELNKTKDILASLSALSSIVPSLRTLGAHSALETTLYAIQTSTMMETSQTFLRLFAKLGAFSNAGVISPLQANQLLPLIGKLVEFDWPREACVGVDGPTWKLLASEFEVARWTALSSLCVQVNHSLHHDSDQVTLIVEHCVSRCDAVSIENIPSLMHVVKTIFPLLVNTEVSSATVDTYLNGMIRAMKQEKTFMSRQVYHLLGGVLTPAVLHCTRMSNAIISFLHQALSFADCSIGIANWLVQLIAASFENPSSDSEQHAIRLIPVLFNLAIFGPIRQSGLNPPSNIDLEIAGVKGEITDPFVRSTTISLLCSRLGNFTLFHTKLFRYALGQVDDTEESNPESNHSPAATLFLHVADYTMAKGKAGAYRHLLNYRRFQLCSLISRHCDFDLLERCVWPLLHAEHVVSVRELVTLTASILVTRTLASDRSEVQLKLLSKMNAIVSTLQSESTTKLNEDSAFAWITIAGVVLQRVNLRTQPHLVSGWTSLFQLLLPFLTYNSLYLRGTVQELFLNTMKIKINDFSFLSNDFVAYLKSLNNFLTALLGARPLNRANRRELFYADFLKSYDAGVAPTEEQQREILRLVVVLHPEQHQMQSIELVSNSALDSSWKIATGALDNVFTEPGSLIDHPGPIAEELRQKLVSEFLGITPQDVDKSSKAELSAASESCHDTIQAPTDASQMTFQRKILPWQSIDLKDDKASSSSSGLGASELIALDKTQKVAKGRQELIVVATLLQKIPNFAGLTRTAEIFNASKLILPSLSIVKDKAFQDIAVTADQWLPIEEVTEADLPAWLRSQQKLGFSLIGVEQTSNSVSLVGYEFPQKTVLLLGEEKHGIPVELIQMLDKCVEIPQLGIIRSLNVHVSASIMIWEYTKQQLEAK